MARPMIARLGEWLRGPRSLIGQMLLAVAIGLLLVQGFGAVLVYRAQAQIREADLLHAAAFRLIAATSVDVDPGFGHETRPPDARFGRPPGGDGADVPIGGDNNGGGGGGGGGRGPRPVHSQLSPLRGDDRRDRGSELDLRAMLADEGLVVDDVIVTRRAIATDSPSLLHVQARPRLFSGPLGVPDQVMIAAAHLTGGDWIVARVFFRENGRGLAVTLLWQTLLIYLFVVGAIALIARRITRPLAALTTRLERFAATRSVDGQLAPAGPRDVRRLILAHNAMEARIAALLDEKDVMLGAIGHDLKTPLAALRVRIESVGDETERERMAATIEDIVRTLDDMLSLARVGRPSQPLERTELSALVASVVEEYEDMGEPVELGETRRIALALRSTWLRRALRNLIGNGLRYGRVARVSLARVDDAAVIRIDDDGPGIPEDEIARMTDPFTRGDRSRNSETGGAGLGLALADAIADQHGGALVLANRRHADGTIAGLTATLTLPIA